MKQKLFDIKLKEYLGWMCYRHSFSVNVVEKSPLRDIRYIYIYVYNIYIYIYIYIYTDRQIEEKRCVGFGGAFSMTKMCAFV